MKSAGRLLFGPPRCLLSLVLAFFGAMGCSPASNSDAGEGEASEAGAPGQGEGRDDGGTGSGKDDVEAGRRLGGPCSEDADCPDAAFCMRPDADLFLGGGPPQPTCVADCTLDERACVAFSNARCVDVSRSALHEERALCLETCPFGEPVPEKCHGREDVACESTSAGGFCRPLCSTDGDCGAGLRCAPDLGVCQPEDDSPSEPLALGAGCLPEQEPGETGCSGICVQNGAAGVCSTRCVFGSLAACTETEPATMGTACVLVSPGGTIGDVGFCSPLCECDQDCPPGTLCSAFDEAVLTDAFGAQGSCVPANGASGIACEP